jgi:hypothetical protein
MCLVLASNINSVNLFKIKILEESFMKRIYVLVLMVLCVASVAFSQEINRTIVSFTVNGKDVTEKYYLPFCEGDDLDVHYIMLIHRIGSDNIISKDISKYAVDNIMYSENDFIEKKNNSFFYNASVNMWENSAAETRLCQAMDDVKYFV